MPRYTRYPTVPFWNDKLDAAQWKANFSQVFAEQNHTNGTSLYIQFPFCELLCTYCGCNKKSPAIIWWKNNIWSPLKKSGRSTVR